MAYSFTRSCFGVCGNFRFKMFSVTDAASTNSVIKPEMNVRFVASTNTSDNADHFRARTLLWTGTCDGDVENKLVDSSETFVPQLTGSQVTNTTDATSSEVEYTTDTDRMYLVKKKQKAADGSPVGDFARQLVDLCPTGTETYTIADDHKVMITPVTGNDDGTLFIIGE